MMSSQYFRLFVGAVLGFVIFSFGAVAPTWGAAFLVNSAADEVDVNPGDGVCQTASGGGVCSLRAAIQEANALSGADTVYISAGTWTLSITGADENDCATGDLDIYDHLSVIGAGPALSTVDANGIDRVFHLHNVNALDPAPVVSFTGLTITGGDASPASSPQGGGVFAEAQGVLTFEQVRITANTANLGAGMRLIGGATTLNGCSIHGNVIVNLGVLNPHGEGLYVGSGELEIRASSITGNTGVSSSSAAVLLHGVDDALITNSTIAGNFAIGLYIYNSNAEVTQCTIVGNGSNGLSFGSFDGTDELILGSSILYANTSGNCYIGSGVYTHSGNIDGGDTCLFDIASQDLVNTDPMLDGNSTCADTVCYEPRPGSPAIDMLPITHPLIQWEDQRGARRPMDGDWDGEPLYDAGAIESGLVFADDFESGNVSAWS